MRPVKLLTIFAIAFLTTQIAFAQTEQQKHDQLVARNYQGNVRLRVNGESTYAAPDGNSNAIIKSGGAFVWRTVFATYNNQNAHYWIYRADMNRAWQVDPNVAFDNLKFWNFDGHAAGNPENWEQFDFEDAGGLNVRIRSVVNGRYIVINGSRLEATALQNGASLFRTEFP